MAERRDSLSPVPVYTSGAAAAVAAGAAGAGAFAAGAEAQLARKIRAVKNRIA
jgi:hypothetical protein